MTGHICLKSGGNITPEEIELSAYNIVGPTQFIMNMSPNYIIPNLGMEFTEEEYQNITFEDMIYESSGETYEGQQENFYLLFRFYKITMETIYVYWSGYVSENAQILITNYVDNIDASH